MAFHITFNTVEIPKSLAYEWLIFLISSMGTAILVLYSVVISWQLRVEMIKCLHSGFFFFSLTNTIFRFHEVRSQVIDALLRARWESGVSDSFLLLPLIRFLLLVLNLPVRVHRNLGIPTLSIPLPSCTLQIHS